jgi:hypothetical protein
LVGFLPILIASTIELNLEVEKNPTESDRNGWEQDMKRYVGGKLNAAQDNGVKHLLSFNLFTGIPIF